MIRIGQFGYAKSNRNCLRGNESTRGVCPFRSDNVYYEDDMVYYGDEAVASAEGDRHQC